MIHPDTVEREFQRSQIAPGSRATIGIADVAVFDSVMECHRNPDFRGDEGVEQLLQRMQTPEGDEMTQEVLAGYALGSIAAASLGVAPRFDSRIIDGDLPINTTAANLKEELQIVFEAYLALDVDRRVSWREGWTRRFEGAAPLLPFIDN